MTQFNTDEPQKRSNWIIGGVVFGMLVIIVAVIFFMRRSDDDHIVPPVAQNEYVADRQEVSEPTYYGSFTLDEIGNVHRVGDEVLVRVLVDTQNRNVTIGRSYVEYDPTVLEFVGVRSANSVFEMGLFEKQEDNYVFIARAVPGDGIVNDTDDGYTGASGELATIVFRALQTGKAQISIDVTKSGMNADNGMGTEFVVDAEPIDVFIQ